MGAQWSLQMEEMSKWRLHQWMDLINLLVGRPKAVRAHDRSLEGTFTL